jgi:hypothetical protein
MKIAVLSASNVANWYAASRLRFSVTDPLTVIVPMQIPKAKLKNATRTSRRQRG